jgi:hypothetical protein
VYDDLFSGTVLTRAVCGCDWLGFGVVDDMVVDGDQTWGGGDFAWDLRDASGIPYWWVYTSRDDGNREEEEK